MIIKNTKKKDQNNGISRNITKFIANYSNLRNCAKLFNEKRDRRMKIKHKKALVYTSDKHGSKKPMKKRHRMLWKDEDGYFWYQSNIYWEPVRCVTSDIWIIDYRYRTTQVIPNKKGSK